MAIRNEEAATVKVGDVIEDGDGYPAVVFEIDAAGQPTAICRTVEPWRGQVTGPGLFLRRYTDPNTIEWAREIGRATWRATGRRTVSHA